LVAQPSDGLPPRTGAAVPGTGDDAPDGDAAGAPVGQGTARGLGIATSEDASGVPLHRGWAPATASHRWLEPFVLMALANGSAHGYAIVGQLTEVGITVGALDVGQVYRTLRDLEQAGQVVSTWATGTGPARREYTITEQGSRALDEWAAVMKERKRLIAEFDAAYFGWVAGHIRPDGRR
jgi:poly-beta-hydroxybutyrate-responsive repressor